MPLRRRAKRHAFPSRLGAFLVAASLAGCAGGGASPAVVASAPARSSGTALGSATLAFTIPYAPIGASATRRPAYVSSKTVAIAAVLNAADADTPAQVAAYDAHAGAPVVETLGSGGSCPATPAGYACTLTLLLPVGNDALTFTTYDGATASAHVLSQMSQSFAIVAGTANAFTLTLDANTATFTVTPPSGVTLSGSGCGPTATTIAGSGDLSATCSAIVPSAAASSPLAFTFSIADLAGATIPATTTGFPVLSVASSNPSAFTATLSGETVTVTPVAPLCPAAGPIGTTTITIAATPATPATDGLAPTSIAFTLATAPYTGQRLYVSNDTTDTVTVYPVKPQGTVSAFPLAELCAPSGASAGAETLSSASGIAIDPAGKYLYVTNFDGGASNAGFVSIFPLPTGFAAAAPLATIDDANGGAISAPEGVAVDASGRVYVTIRSNGVGAGSIAIFGDPLAAGASKTAAPLTSVTGLDEPFGLRLDGSGRIDLAQYSANAFDIYSAYATAGVAPLKLSENSTSAPPFADTVNLPTDVVVDATGLIYLLDLGTDSVGIYSAYGGVPMVAPTLQGTLGTGIGGLFSLPYGIAIDASGGLYVADCDRGDVQYFAPFSAASPPTVATGTIAGAGTGISAKTCPYGIAIH